MSRDHQRRTYRTLFRDPASKGGGRKQLSKPDIAFAKTLECGPVGADDVRVNRFSGGNQPRVVLSQSPGRSPLQSASASLSDVHALNGEPLQRRNGGCLVFGAFEYLFDADD